MAFSGGLARFCRFDARRPLLAAGAGEDSAFRDVHVARDLPQSDAGSEGGFDLLPSFGGYLAAHVRLNLTTAASDCKVQNVASR